MKPNKIVNVEVQAKNIDDITKKVIELIELINKAKTLAKELDLVDIDIDIDVKN